MLFRSFNTYTGLIPQVGDIITVTTWNDTRQQNILTEVFVGPTQGTVTVQEGYDETLFDQASLNNTPGSFDYSEGQSVTVNGLYLNREITDPGRLWVTLNGKRLFVNNGFTVENGEIVLSAGYIMNPSDIVIITEFTNSISPEGMAFRIFQDMRGVQATYRITPATTTYLVEALGQYDDIIYVHDVGALSEPNLAANV